MECWAIGIVLLFHTGAVTILLVIDLSLGSQRTLQILPLPFYLVTIFLAARHPRQLMTALSDNIALAFIFALPIMSTLWSISPTITLRRAIGLTFSVLLAYVIATRTTPRQFLVIVSLAFGSCMLASLLLAAIAPQLAYMPGGHELRGVFNHKNVLGWMAAISVLATANLLFDRSARMPGLGLVLLLASLACLLLSRSGTSLVVAATAGFFSLIYVLLRRSRGASRIVIMLLAILFVLAAASSIDLIMALVLDSVDKDPSLTGRVPIWQLVDENIAKRPLLGFGYQAFWTEGNPEAWRIWTKLAWMAPHSHNGYRDWLLSCGIIGTIPLLVVLARAITRGAWLHWHEPQEGWLWLNVLICVFIVMNLTETVLLVQNSALFIIFVTAVLMVSAPHNRSRVRPPGVGGRSEQAAGQTIGRSYAPS